MRRSQNVVPGVFAVVASAGLVSSVWGQAGVEPGATATAEALEGPLDLPGQQRGDRQRPAPATPEPEPAAAEPAEWFGGLPWSRWSRVTGNWGGARDRLSDAGIEIGASYVMDFSSVLSGGIEQDSSVRQLLDLNALGDLDKLVGWSGARFFLDGQFSFTGGGSLDAGDFQGISGISTGDRNIHQLSQAWLEQELFDEVLRVKLGKIDAASEFNFVSIAGDYLNSSAINTINVLSAEPTYPNPATGVVAFVYPVERAYLGAGFFDGATLDGFPTGPRGLDSIFSDDSSSYFFIGEAGLSWDPDSGAGRASIGVWHHTAELGTFAGGTKDGVTGFYAMVEHQVWRRGTGEDQCEKGVHLFAHAGTSDDDVTAAALTAAFGAVLRGTFEGRDDDAAGVVLGLASFSGATGSTFDGDEVALEAYYKAFLTPAISVTPDVQYIMNPSGDPTIDDALVLGLRVTVSF